MDMKTAKEIRKYLDEIDYYEKRLKEIEDCVKLDVVICDGYNGYPTTYNRNDIEVKAIIEAYKKEIAILNLIISEIKVVESNE